MKKLLLLLLAATLSAPSIAQKGKKAKPAPAATPAPAPDQADRMRHIAQMEQRMLTPMHNLLTQWAGHWRDEYKVWSDPKVTEPTTSRAERDGRIVSEGRFLATTVRGEIGNMHYEAESVLGFDRLKDVFVKTWYDNMSTSILVLEGTYDEKNNQIDFRGSTVDPASRQPVKVHQVLKLISPEEQVLEVYVQQKDGREIKTMEIRSTRN